jgi:hypothetical protein
MFGAAKSSARQSNTPKEALAFRAMKRQPSLNWW